MTKLSVLGLVMMVGAVQALGACAASPSTDALARQSSILGHKIEQAPLDTKPSEREFSKRPGLLSGKEGQMTVYRKLDRGSADLSKPAKVRR